MWNLQSAKTCLAIVREIGVKTQVESYQRLKYTHHYKVSSTIKYTHHYKVSSTIKYTHHYKVWKVKWSNPENLVEPSPTPWCRGGLFIMDIPSSKKYWNILVWLVAFYAISTLMSYLMPDPFHTYIFCEFFFHLLSLSLSFAHSLPLIHVRIITYTHNGENDFDLITQSKCIFYCILCDRLIFKQLFKFFTNLI